MKSNALFLLLVLLVVVGLGLLFYGWRVRDNTLLKYSRELESAVVIDLELRAVPSGDFYTITLDKPADVEFVRGAIRDAVRDELPDGVGTGMCEMGAIRFLSSANEKILEVHLIQESNLYIGKERYSLANIYQTLTAKFPQSPK